MYLSLKNITFIYISTAHLEGIFAYSSYLIYLKNEGQMSLSTFYRAWRGYILHVRRYLAI